jgi:hypothetical protein
MKSILSSRKELRGRIGWSIVLRSAGPCRAQLRQDLMYYCALVDILGQKQCLLNFVTVASAL